MKSNGGYQSIFLGPDWIYEKYYGWTIVVARSDFKVLSKSSGPIKRYLVLSQLEHEQLRGELSQLGVFRFLSTVTIKDFSTPNQDNYPDFPMNLLRVQRAEETERMFNKYTFVIDLTQEVDRLWSNMKSDNQRVCKKASASGVLIECLSSPTGNLLDIFFDRYRKMANDRSIAMPSKRVIGEMFRDGCLRMFYAKAENTIRSMILVYSAAATSFYLYGVPGDIRNDGSGQLVQWHAITYFKAAGQRWYDFGGIPEKDGSNGIYRFKKSFGGKFVDLGTEYYYCPDVLLIGKRVFRKLRSVL